MKRFAPLLFTFTIALVALPAFATDRDYNTDSDSDSNGDSDGNQGGTAGVPELDKSIAGSAAVLLGGGVFVILGRRRRVG